MKELTLRFRKQNNDVAKPIMYALRKGFKKVVKSRNKKIKDAHAVMEKIPEAPGHYGGVNIIITGPDDFIDKEEKKVEEALYKLLNQFKTDPNLAKNFYHKFKALTVNWSKEQLLKSYGMIGILVEWEKKNDVQP